MTSHAVLSEIAALVVQTSLTPFSPATPAEEATHLTQLPQSPEGSSASTAAQTAGQSDFETFDSGEIIVTAQRRAEPMQKVPIAIAVLQPAQLQQQNITDLITLRANVAGFDYKTTGINSGIYIRGIGQDGGLPNNENSVSLYVDDIYMGGLHQMAKMPFTNIEQLVVLKGPQGTLFGRNATGGVVQVITPRPDHDPAMDASIGYGNYATVTGSFYVTGGVTDKIAANVSLYYKNQDKGFGRNLYLDKKVNYQNDLNVRSKILFEPSERTEIILSADYTYFEGGGLNNYPGPGNTRFGPEIPDDFGRFDTYTGYNEGDFIRHGGASLKISQELDFANLVSITAYRKMRGLQKVDPDGTPVNFVTVNSYFRGTQFTQELQLLSKDESDIKWTLGAFYLKATPFFGQDFFEISRYLQTRQLTESIAAFGQVTYPIFEGTNITGGLRYTYETQKLVDAYTQFPGQAPTIFPDKKTTVKKPTWRISLDQQISDDILAYASYNRGIKTGGYNMGSPAAAAYQPEQLDAYEVGLKTQLFNRRVRFNVAAFYYDYQNLQVSQAAAGTAFLSNAAAGRIYGVDGDINIRATDELTLFGSFGFINGEYKSFPNAAAYSPTGVLVEDTPGQGLDVTGNDTTYAPDFSGSAGMQYEKETQVGTVSLGANVSYFGGSFTTPDNFSRIPAYTLINASIGWTSPSGRFDARLWGANLANEKYLSYSAQNASGLQIRAGAPRTYGVTIGVHY